MPQNKPKRLTTPPQAEQVINEVRDYLQWSRVPKNGDRPRDLTPTLPTLPPPPFAHLGVAVSTGGDSDMARLIQELLARTRTTPQDVKSIGGTVVPESKLAYVNDRGFDSGILGAFGMKSKHMNLSPQYTRGDNEGLATLLHELVHAGDAKNWWGRRAQTENTAKRVDKALQPGASPLQIVPKPPWW